MSKFPSLPFWTDAYLADTAHLTDAEHGRYLLLILLAWRMPRCRLPNDDQWLARHLRRSVEEVKTEIRPIIEEFWYTTGNYLSQRRLQREFERVAATSRRNSDRAKRRWANDKQPYSGNAGAAMQAPQCRPRNASKPITRISANLADIDTNSPQAPAREEAGRRVGLGWAEGQNSGGNGHDERADAVGRECLRILGHEADPGWHAGPVHQWLADEADPERDIYPALRAAVESGHAERARAMAYFTPMIEERLAGGGASAGNGKAKPDNGWPAATQPELARDGHDGASTCASAGDMEQMSRILVQLRAGDAAEANRLGLIAVEQYGRPPPVWGPG